MKNTRLQATRRHSKGFTLIASLLIMLLLSGIAIGLMLMVNTEGKVGGTDLQNNLAFHAAEGGIEKMASDLNATFGAIAAPTPAQICAVGATANQPSMVGVTWQQYYVTPGTVPGPTCPSSLNATWGTIGGNGQNAGLQAQIIPVNMMATAAMLGGQEVTMTRQSQVALIPAFQFGVFSENDLLFENGGTLDFAGPVHTNADLYPFSAGTLTFHDKLSAYGNVVRTQLPNSIPGSTYNGPVYIPSATNDCAQGGGVVAGSCTQMASTAISGSPYGDGSVTGAGSTTFQSGAAYVPDTGTDTWSPFSKVATNLMIVNGNYGNKANPGTGAKQLSMSFVGGGSQPYEIIRRPPVGEDPTSAVSEAREYNLAQIRVLLSDDPTEFQNGSGWSDAENVRLANITTQQASLQGGNATATNPYGITIASGNFVSSTFGSPTAGNTYNLYFAAASNAVPVQTSCSGTTCSADWPYAPYVWNSGAAPLNPNPTLQGLQPTPLAPIYLDNGATPTISLCPPANVNASSTPTPSATCPWTGAYPYYAPPNPLNPNGTTPYNSVNSNAWGLIDGYLRVEYRDASGVWHPVTNEWLALGFARGVTAPTAPGPSGAGSNPINPNAILLLQQPADRLTSTPATLPTELTLSSIGTAPTCTKTVAGVCKTWTPGVPPQLAADTADVVATASYADWAFGLTPTTPPTSTPQSITQYNWYPINFYDAREGEVREQSWTVAGTQPTHTTDTTCTTNGVMNAVEIDVGNLKRWLSGGITGSGTSVDYAAQNGYVLYFSDRRGMLLNPNPTSTHLANTKSGDSGLEDVINANGAGDTSVGTPDGALEPIATGRTYSPEDVNENGVLDNWGAANLGFGFYGTVANATQNLNTLINTNPAKPDPYSTGGTGTAGYTTNRIASCGTTGRKNFVSGARHVLKLVDGAYGNVPLRPSALVITNPDGTTTSYWGGFTVASENPVYVQGDYNSSTADEATWTNPPATPTDLPLHSAASIIADSVTLLSEIWDDRVSMLGASGSTSPTYRENRLASPNTYYRMGIAAGKNMNFKSPSWGLSGINDIGIDGALGNFMRLLEDWSSSPSNPANDTLNYYGSLVSLYYSTYNTGIFKCGGCWEVYVNGNRNYIFDEDFTNPYGLPPGTPTFHTVESLSYRQLFSTRTF